MKAVEGDLGLPGLGLSDENKMILIEEVSIVFNGAASLRLEAGLKDAVRHNTTGTKHVLDLAVEMKKLEVTNIVLNIIKGVEKNSDTHLINELVAGFS